MDLSLLNFFSPNFKLTLKVFFFYFYYLIQIVLFTMSFALSQHIFFHVISKTHTVELGYNELSRTGKKFVITVKRSSREGYFFQNISFFIFHRWYT